MDILCYEELEQIIMLVFFFLLGRYVSFLFMCPFVCLGTCMCPVCVGAKNLEEGIRFPGAEVRDSCELPVSGAGT